MLTVLNKIPLGERVLPAEYIGTLDKPANITWEEFTEKCRTDFLKKQFDFLKKKKEKDAMKNATSLLQDQAKKAKEDQQRKEYERQQADMKAQEQREREEKEKLEKEEAALNREVEEVVNGALADIPLFAEGESGYNSEQNDKEETVTPIMREDNGTVERNSNSVSSKVGKLIVDPDVLFALQNLKEVGKCMRLNAAGLNTTVPTMPQNANNSTSASAPGFNAASVNIKTEPDDQNRNSHPFGNQSQVGSSSFGKLPNFSSLPQQTTPRTLTSPPGPGRVFGSFKRHSVDSFSGNSGKKRKPNTPGRNAFSSPAGTPARICENVEANLALAESKCKLADAGDVFLKKKKTTPANTSVLFQAISERGKEVVVFDDHPQSFYKIMAFYAKGYEMVPEDTRFRTLKENLFDFVMENMKFTQVRELICFISAFL